MSNLKEFFTSLVDVFKFDQSKEPKSSATTESLSGIRFHINSKESKPIEILIQQMFLYKYQRAIKRLKKNLHSISDDYKSKE